MSDHDQFTHRNDEIKGTLLLHNEPYTDQSNAAFKDFDTLPLSSYSNIYGLWYHEAAVNELTSPGFMDHVSAPGAESASVVPNLEDYMPSLPVPEELVRERTGGSIFDTESVVGELGRSYHGYKDGKYLLPNDFAEQDRLDFQHQGFKVLMNGKLQLAPVSSPKHVLDVATGTGIWSLEFAEQNPEAEVIGTDLSAIQPTNMLPNCTFLKDDAEEEWLFSTKFDFVHLRFVTTCFNDPRSIMKQAFDSMTSGGWIEYQDTSVAQILSLNGNVEGTAFYNWAQCVVRGCAVALNRDVEVARQYQHWMREVGFINVREEKLMWPVGSWFKDNKTLELAGAYLLRNLLDGAILATWKILIASGLSEGETQNLVGQAKEEILEENSRFYLTVYVVYGQKP